MAQALDLEGSPEPRRTTYIYIRKLWILGFGASIYTYIVLLCMLLGPCSGQVIACTASFGDTAILQAKVTCMERSQVREQSHIPSVSVAHNVEHATRVGSRVKVKSPRVEGSGFEVEV